MLKDSICIIRDMKKMRIAFANDHATFEARVALIEHLRDLGHEVLDCGTSTKESVDYPCVVVPAIKALREGAVDRIVLMCGSGLGVSIAANRYEGIRCALCTDEYAAEMSRRHNNANAIALRAREQDPAMNIRVLDKWLTTDYEGGRHQRRVELIDSMPKNEKF